MKKTLSSGLLGRVGRRSPEAEGLRFIAMLAATVLVPILCVVGTTLMSSTVAVEPGTVNNTTIVQNVCVSPQPGQVVNDFATLDDP